MEFLQTFGYVILSLLALAVGAVIAIVYAIAWSIRHNPDKAQRMMEQAEAKRKQHVLACSSCCSFREEKNIMTSEYLAGGTVTITRCCRDNPDCQELAAYRMFRNLQGSQKAEKVTPVHAN